MPSTLLEDIRNWFRPAESGEDVTLAPFAENHTATAAPSPSWSMTRRASAR